MKQGTRSLVSRLNSGRCPAAGGSGTACKASRAGLGLGRAARGARRVWTARTERAAAVEAAPSGRQGSDRRRPVGSPPAAGPLGGGGTVRVDPSRSEPIRADPSRSEVSEARCGSWGFGSVLEGRWGPQGQTASTAASREDSASGFGSPLPRWVRFFCHGP